MIEVLNTIIRKTQNEVITSAACETLWMPVLLKLTCNERMGNEVLKYGKIFSNISSVLAKKHSLLKRLNEKNFGVHETFHS